MKNARHIPRLTVVGAGIGDPDLITVKAVKALGQADVVLYDALVNKSLLEHAPEHAICIYVGKRRQHKAFNQEQINDLIVQYALRNGHVVRLKGGDPLVFGRGHEEMEFALSNGIPAEYIPGISSAVAAAGNAGIPVTLRGASRSFWVLTATTSTGELNPEILDAAQSEATVIILMGLAKLPEITAVFSATQRRDCPVAVIQNASLPNQKTIIGSVQTIVEKVSEAAAGSPAVIVLGEVVRHQLKSNTAPDFQALIPVFI